MKSLHRFEYGVYQLVDHFLGRDLGVKLTSKKREKLYRRIAKHLKSRGNGKEIPIDRRSNLSLEEFKKEYQKKAKPVVFSKAALNWDCVQKWSLDYFKEIHGLDKISFVNQLDIKNDVIHMTLSELIDGIKSGEGHYYRFYPLLSRHPEHISEFDYNWLRTHENKISYYNSFQVFMGGDGSYTPIHNANQANLFTQVHGVKEWKLYDYRDTAIIDPSPIRNVYREAPLKTKDGAFNPFKPDYSGPYKLYEYIDTYTATLEPGDVLWNPPYFWHAIQNHGDTIGVGYRWLSPFYAFKISPLYAVLDCLIKNPPVWKAYKLSQKDFNVMQMIESGQLNNSSQ